VKEVSGDTKGAHDHLILMGRALVAEVSLCPSLRRHSACWRNDIFDSNDCSSFLETRRRVASDADIARHCKRGKPPRAAR
jgi:hypothetical protein